MNYIRRRHDDLNVCFIGLRCTNQTYGIAVQRRRVRFDFSTAGSNVVYFW